MLGFLRFWARCFSISLETILHWEGVLGIILPAALTASVLAGYGAPFQISDGAIIRIACALFGARLFLIAPYQAAASRPYLFAPTPNALAKEAFQHILHRDHLTHREVLNKLSYDEAYNQMTLAAARGDLTVWGRQDGSHRRIDTPPLVAIEPTYWLEVSFDYSHLIHQDLADRTNNYLHLPATQEKYFDLFVDISQVRRNWRTASLTVRVLRWTYHFLQRTLGSWERSAFPRS